MTKTKVSIGNMCVGDIRLCAIDVGFDPRVAGQKIALPAKLDGLKVGYEDDGQPWIASGTRAEIVAELQRAGYTIAENP